MRQSGGADGSREGPRRRAAASRAVRDVRGARGDGELRRRMSSGRGGAGQRGDEDEGGRSASGAGGRGRPDSAAAAVAVALAPRPRARAGGAAAASRPSRAPGMVAS